jgi:hypothetical protein
MSWFRDSSYAVLLFFLLGCNKLLGGCSSQNMQLCLNEYMLEVPRFVEQLEVDKSQAQPEHREVLIEVIVGNSSWAESSEQ